MLDQKDLQAIQTIVTQSETRTLAAMDEKISQSEARTFATMNTIMDEKISQSEARTLAAMNTIIDEKISQSETRTLAAMNTIMDEKISQSEARILAAMDKRFDKSENAIVRELDLVQQKTNRQISELKKDIAELKRRQKETPAADGSIYIRMIADLQNQIDAIRLKMA